MLSAQLGSGKILMAQSEGPGDGQIGDANM